MRRLQRLRSIRALFFLAVLVVIFTSDTPATSTQETANPRIAGDGKAEGVSRAARDANADEARWKNGELLAPLPADPAKRAEAIRLAKETGRAHASSQGLAPAAGIPGTRGEAQPQKVAVPGPRGVSRDARPRTAPPFPEEQQPPVEAFVPTAEQLREASRVPEIAIPPSMAPAVPGVMNSFDAVDYTGWTPPSPDIAAGPQQVLVAATDVFAIYDKCGNWIDGGDYGTRFGISTDYVLYDPRVVYDDWDSRWVMAYLAIDLANQRSRISFAISRTANLEDGWDCYYTAAFAATGNYADNMYMAVDPEGIYFTFNEFDFVTYASEGASVLALDKEAAYNCESVSWYSYRGLVNPGDASTAFSVRPAQMHSYPGAMYFLNNKHGGGTIFTFWSLADPFGAALVPTSITTPAYTLPPPMRQPNGTYVKTGDCRIADLVYDDRNLQAAFVAQYSPSGTAYTRINLWNFDTSPVGVADAISFIGPQSYLTYPSIELDAYGRTGLSYVECAYVTPQYLSMKYIIWDWQANAFVELGGLVGGLADFTLGGSGTTGNPYRWGNYTGCALDPMDSRTFWMCGPYAHNDPTPSWMTHVGAVSAFPESDLYFEPSSPTTGGVEGGPFLDDALPVKLWNMGETDLNWAIETYPSWVTPSAMMGVVPRGAYQTVSFLLNEEARELPPGIHNAAVTFRNCTGNVGGTCELYVAIVEPISCPTAALSLAPPIGDAVGIYGADEYSLFVTAMEDIDVCAMGLMLAHTEPSYLTCYVFQADGTTRGAHVYSNSEVAVQDADGIYLVRMDCTLQACQDYEIVFTHPSSIAHATYDETDFSYPFDVNGVIRVRQSATNGSVGDTKHPGIVVFGHASCGDLTGRSTDLYRSAPEHAETSANTTQGLFVTARENLYLCSVGFEGDLVRDRWLSAGVWEATGNVRGPLVAQGFLPVQAGGLAEHEVPIHAFLEAGREYNISVDISETGYWPALAEAGVSLPYTVDGIIEVRKGEFNGAASTNLPHLWLNWEEVAARGVPFDLAKSADGIPAPYTASGVLDHGVFVQPAATQNIYSLGVRADIPEGTTVIARIYRLTVTGVRGPLQTEGVIKSAGDGMRWHDVPLALTWQGGVRYDLSIVCSNVAEVGYWYDTTGMPYAPYGGTIQVQNAERGGDPAWTELVHLRINACNEAATGIGDDPLPFTPFTLEAPVPNPANGLVRLRYSADAPSAMDLEIYDVAGRRVASVFSGRHLDAGPGTVDFDASGLASGVYFLKLTAGDRSVSRKIVITR